MRFRFQFSLRTLFIIVTLICVALGLYVAPKVRRHNLVLCIEAAGGTLRYDAESADESWLTKQLRKHLPQDWFDEITIIDLAQTDASDETLAGFETLSGLRELRMFTTRVTDAGLAHLRGLTDLEGLHIARTQVTDAGLMHLHGLAALQRLELDETQITDAGLAQLQSLRALRELSLCGTHVTDAGLSHLKSHADLQYLNLLETQVGDAGRADLQKFWPHCLILWAAPAALNRQRTEIPNKIGSGRFE